MLQENRYKIMIVAGALPLMSGLFLSGINIQSLGKIFTMIGIGLFLTGVHKFGRLGAS